MLKFLYNTLVGRILLKLIFTRRTFSNCYAFYMKSSLSKPKIKKFIKNNNINLEEYEKSDYKSFNEFFIRHIKKENRSVNLDENILISVADAKIKSYKIATNLQLEVKNTIYGLDELLGNNKIAKQYAGGDCLILRLTLEDYHRYCYIDNGTQEENKKIKGVLHTVRPISVQNGYKVYSQNSREWTILHTENFGDIIQIEVGALLVGKIKNHYENYNFKKGEEKGYFEFGGSTIVLLMKKGIVEIDKTITKNSEADIETVVKLGEKIGDKIC